LANCSTIFNAFGPKRPGRFPDFGENIFDPGKALWINELQRKWRPKVLKIGKNPENGQNFGRRGAEKFVPASP
jgi:hypothetical protein